MSNLSLVSFDPVPMINGNILLTSGTIYGYAINLAFSGVEFIAVPLRNAGSIVTGVSKMAVYDINGVLMRSTPNIPNLWTAGDDTYRIGELTAKLPRIAEHAVHVALLSTCTVRPSVYTGTIISVEISNPFPSIIKCAWSLPGQRWTCRRVSIWPR